MLDKNKLDAIVRDLRGYFNQATPEDPARNQGLAREIIVRYGPLYPTTPETIIVEGFALALIGDDLRQAPNALALTHALNNALARFGYMIDFVSARGNSEARVVLGVIVQTSTDEDLCALAAVLLASPHFADPILKNIVQERFNRTEGTSCQMALALALYQCGDDSKLKKFVHEAYLPDYISIAKREHMSEQDSRGVIAHMLMPYILKIVIEDCGTEGRGFDVLYGLRSRSPHLAWRRKQYND